MTCNEVKKNLESAVHTPLPEAIRKQVDVHVRECSTGHMKEKEIESRWLDAA